MIASTNLENNLSQSTNKSYIFTGYFAMYLSSVLSHGKFLIHKLTFYLQHFIVRSRCDASRMLHYKGTNKSQRGQTLTINDKGRSQPRVQNRNRSRREIDNKFPGGATRNSLPVLVASRRAHISRSSAAASEQWGFGCTIFNGDNPTCREGLVARESNLLCHRIT